MGFVIKMTEAQERYRVLIIGCGNIAGRFDLDRLPLEYPLTHACAFLQDGRFSIAACVEPDDEKRFIFMESWGIPVGFGSIDELKNTPGFFDVVSICSLTHSHESDLEAILQMRPKLIFCEKPITESVSVSEALVATCRRLNVFLAVNYTRRWDPELVRLQSEMQDGRRYL